MCKISSEKSDLCLLLPAFPPSLPLILLAPSSLRWTKGLQIRLPCFLFRAYYAQRGLCFTSKCVKKMQLGVSERHFQVEGAFACTRITVLSKISRASETVHPVGVHAIIESGTVSACTRGNKRHLHTRGCQSEQAFACICS